MSPTTTEIQSTPRKATFEDLTSLLKAGLKGPDHPSKDLIHTWINIHWEFLTQLSIILREGFDYGDLFDSSKSESGTTIPELGMIIDVLDDILKNATGPEGPLRWISRDTFARGNGWGVHDGTPSERLIHLLLIHSDRPLSLDKICDITRGSRVTTKRVLKSLSKKRIVVESSSGDTVTYGLLTNVSHLNLAYHYANREWGWYLRDSGDKSHIHEFIASRGLVLR